MDPRTHMTLRRSLYIASSHGNKDSVPYVHGVRGVVGNLNGSEINPLHASRKSSRKDKSINIEEENRVRHVQCCRKYILALKSSNVYLEIVMGSNY